MQAIKAGHRRRVTFLAWCGTAGPFRLFCVLHRSIEPDATPNYSFRFATAVCCNKLTRPRAHRCVILHEEERSSGAGSMFVRSRGDEEPSERQKNKKASAPVWTGEVNATPR